MKKKIIISAVCLFMAATAAMAQRVKLYDNSSSIIGYVDGNTVYNSTMSVVATIGETTTFGEEVRDGTNVIAYVDGNEIKDRNLNVVAIIKDNTVRDRTSNIIARVDSTALRDVIRGDILVRLEGDKPTDRQLLLIVYLYVLKSN